MTKDELLLDMCKRTATVTMGYDPKIYSIPHLARCLNESKYRIRKLMKELEADGAVRRSYDGGIDDDGYPHCYHGWSITKKTYDSELYKKCDKEAIAEFEKFTQDFDEEWRREEAERIGNR